MLNTLNAFMDKNRIAIKYSIEMSKVYLSNS